jgi:DNA-binding MarR family transcriptional regulator
VRDDVRRVMDLYPRIFFACHTRHVRDPETGRLLSAHQASILDHLDEREALRLVDLARHMGVTPATMCLHVDRLAAKGYVRRTRDPRDGRQVELRLTAAGLRVREAKTVLDPERVRALLRRLSTGQRSRAIDGLALLARAARQAVEEYARAARLAGGRDEDRAGGGRRPGGGRGAGGAGRVASASRPRRVLPQPPR